MSLWWYVLGSIGAGVSAIGEIYPSPEWSEETISALGWAWLSGTLAMFAVSQRRGSGE